MDAINTPSIAVKRNNSNDKRNEGDQAHKSKFIAKVSRDIRIAVLINSSYVMVEYIGSVQEIIQAMTPQAGVNALHSDRVK